MWLKTVRAYMWQEGREGLEEHAGLTLRCFPITAAKYRQKQFKEGRVYFGL